MALHPQTARYIDRAGLVAAHAAHGLTRFIPEQPGAQARLIVHWRADHSRRRLRTLVFFEDIQKFLGVGLMESDNVTPKFRPVHLASSPKSSPFRYMMSSVTWPLPTRLDSDLGFSGFQGKQKAGNHPSFFVSRPLNSIKKCG
jgi:hypothetical protein